MNGRVLVVDDEKAIVEGLMYMLEAEQIESSGAFDRISAESLMGSAFFPVIVADLRLHTEAEGLELLDGIRRISPRSRVITLTGFSTPEMENEVLRRGAVMVIRKPTAGLDIIGAISKLLAEVEKLAASEETLDLEELHGGLRRLLHSIPRKRFGLTSDESEEIVQQAWLLFLQNRDVIRQARPWLLGTVANLCKHQLGRSYRRRETFMDDQELAEVPAIRIEVDAGIALAQAMAVLDDQSRDLCRLIAIEGYAYDEVSALLQIPLGSIGPMYIRAKSKMRMCLAA
jgi:RNA polymerase sigma factor (sigma-70 family)